MAWLWVRESFAEETVWLDELHRRGIPQPQASNFAAEKSDTLVHSPSRRRKHCRRQRAPRRRSIKRIPQSAKTFMADILLYSGAALHPPWGELVATESASGRRSPLARLSSDRESTRRRKRNREAPSRHRRLQPDVLQDSFKVVSTRVAR